MGNSNSDVKDYEGDASQKIKEKLDFVEGGPLTFLELDLNSTRKLENLSYSLEMIKKYSHSLYFEDLELGSDNVLVGRTSINGNDVVRFSISTLLSDRLNIDISLFLQYVQCKKYVPFSLIRLLQIMIRACGLLLKESTERAIVLTNSNLYSLSEESLREGRSLESFFNIFIFAAGEFISSIPEKYRNDENLILVCDECSSTHILRWKNCFLSMKQSSER